MEEELIPIIVIGLAIAAMAIKTTSGYIQGEMAGISDKGYDITQKEPILIIPKSKNLAPPVTATRKNISKEVVQLPYGVVPAEVITNSLIEDPAKVTQGGLGGGQGMYGPVVTVKSLGPTSLTNPNTPPDVKNMLANAPPDF